MTKQGFPVWGGQGGQVLSQFKITGSDVGASQGSAGLDTRGKALCTIAKSSNAYTLKFKQKCAGGVYVFFQPLTDNGAASNVQVNADSQDVTWNAVERDDNTTALANQDYFVFVVQYTTNIVQ